MNKLMFCIALAGMSANTVQARLLPPLQGEVARFGVAVVDRGSGKPIPDVEMDGEFSREVATSMRSTLPTMCVSGKTDASGVCWLAGRTTNGKVKARIRNIPPDYHRPQNLETAVTFTNVNDSFVWEPQNMVVTVRLERVGHPIPLWVKVVTAERSRMERLEWDGTNSVFRYDLVAGDWLPPIGRGKDADIVFNMHLKMFPPHIWGNLRLDPSEFTFTISFPGRGNGFTEVASADSSIVRVRQAPEDGYQQSFVMKFGSRCHPQPNGQIPSEFYTDTKRDRNVVFRIRSQFDDAGHLTGCYYGKMYGGIQPEGFNWFGDVFTYYLNLNSLDRNLEWDVSHNLNQRGGLVPKALP